MPRSPVADVRAWAGGRPQPRPGKDGRMQAEGAVVRGSGVGLPVSPREAAPWWAALALVGALAWVYTVGQARDMGAGPGTMGMTFFFFVGMWVVMMAAMMLPAIGPQAAGETLSWGRSADVTSRIAGV